MQRHAVFLNSNEDSIRIGRVFAEDRDAEISGFIYVKERDRADKGYYLQSPWWQDNNIPISAREFHHLCLLISAINSNGLPKELTWNA